ncbi:MAG: hypothetical protein L3J32_07005 [Rhizobiaceae bacterium]|nr:hypothetical protein [Rhizobiaceae bacterium]
MNDTEELSRIDKLILEEKRTLAREHFSSAWENAIAEGIDVEIIVDELVSGVLLELARIHGNEAVQKYVVDLGEREVIGEFIPDRILQ